MVLNHLREKDILDNCLPSSIVIGPFYINISNVKKSLSKKLKALSTSMLDILAKNLHKEVDSVSAHLSGHRETPITGTGSRCLQVFGLMKPPALVRTSL